MTWSSVRFDADNGRLQLDRRVFAVLAAYATSAEEPSLGGMGNELVPLRAAGVLVGVRGTEIHPLIEPALHAVANPKRRLLLRYAGRTAQDAHAVGWIDDRCAALLVDRIGFGLAPDPSGKRLGAETAYAQLTTAADPRAAPGLGEPEREPECELISVHPSFIPAVLARLIGLGPRPPLDGMVSSLGDLDEGFTTSSRESEPRRVRAVSDLRAVIRWSPGPGPAGERVLRFERTDTGGWLAASDDGPAPADVATPTQVWLSLVGLLTGPGR